MRALVIVLLVLALAGCSDEPTAGPPPDKKSAASAEVPSTTPSRTPPTASPTPPPPTATPRPRPIRGIDASHHQGVIDWAAVADDGIDFAYLKASEGSTFTDPRFATNREQAERAGLRVGGYHYFSLCTAGATQAAHFVSVLGDLTARKPKALPPAIDLELAGSCATPPPADVLLAEVRTFLTEVEERTGLEAVVYLYPEFEERYGFADDLADHRQWVRSLGSRPAREWWLWQRSDTASIDGIRGNADLNVMRGR